MGVLAKKKIYPTSTEEESEHQSAIDNRQRINSIHIQNQINNHRNNLSKQNSRIDDSQYNSANTRNQTFIIRKAFQTGFNQLSSTIRRPHNRLRKLDSNNVELIQNKYRRNGWDSPLHPLQIAAYFVFLLMTGLIFIYFLPMISLENEKLIYLIYTICILITIVHLILHTLAISINPADDSVITKQRNQPNRKLPTFDRNQHKHVIDSNQFCYICEVHVNVHSKHCSRCNVCIAGFDHHCNWLNTCVGSKNYKLFISSVISALLGSFILLTLSILFIVCWANTNASCLWLDNIYLLDTIDQTNSDNQTNIETDFSAELNETLLPTNSTLPLYSFMTTVSSVLVNDYDNGNFTNTEDSNNSTDLEDDESSTLDESSSHYLTIIHLSTIFFSLILSSITIILLLHLLCFHIFLSCIGMNTYEFIVERREAAQRSNQEKAKMNCNERLLKCLVCQTDCLNLLPKTPSDVTTSQSIIDRNTVHTNLIKKRQLSQQMSNESRMSKNSAFSRESGRFSSRTVSIYEDFATDELSTNKMLATAETDNQVYIGSPKKRVLEEHDLMKTLNNRSLVSNTSTPTAQDLNTVTNQESISNEIYNQTNYAINRSSANQQNSGEHRIEIDSNRLIELNVKKLLNNSDSRSDSVRSNNNRLDRRSIDFENHSRDDKKNEIENETISNSSRNSSTSNRQIIMQRQPIDPHYLDNLSEFAESKVSQLSNNQQATNIASKNIDD